MLIISKEKVHIIPPRSLFQTLANLLFIAKGPSLVGKQSITNLDIQEHDVKQIKFSLSNRSFIDCERNVIKPDDLPRYMQYFVILEGGFFDFRQMSGMESASRCRGYYEACYAVG
ncbi:hypothetical protein ACOSQ3_027153 [Xanthoceras sorbifolium]